MREVSAALNALLADTFALYVKTKNFHWHISGPHFRSYHLLLDEQAEQMEQEGWRAAGNGAATALDVVRLIVGSLFEHLEHTPFALRTLEFEPAPSPAIAAAQST